MLPSAATSGWKAGVVSSVATMALVAVAYRFPATVVIDFGSGIAGALASSGFYDAEGSYRWSRARSQIVFPDPGAADGARIELLLSGFRPPGSPAPRVVIDDGEKGQVLTPSRRVELYSFETRTRGVWSSTSRVQIRSETFTPGGGDERALGVRVHQARLVLPKGSYPPLKQLLASGALAFLVFLSLGGGWTASVACGIFLAAGFAFFRVYATSFVPPLAAGLAAVLVLSRIFPGLSCFLLDCARGFARALREGARAMATRAAILPASAAIVATFVAYAVTTRFEMNIGGGESAPLSRRFAAYDRDPDGTTFREAFPGATIDLRDFGAGRRWTVSIRASLEKEAEPRARSVLAQVGDQQFEADLDSRWSTHAFEIGAPHWGWRSGTVLVFPEKGIRIAEVEVHRDRSLPSFRALALVLGATLSFAGALAGAGLSPRIAASAGGTFAGIIALGLAASPVVFTPFLTRILLATSAALLVAALSRGVLQTLSSRGLAPELSPGSLAVATVAFVLWFLASASPLYSGGHFGYHTSISEEIWQGKFLFYYFPGPGNMLSHQPQWGDLTVPHSNLYHTIASPFAALPREWFHLSTKLFLSLLLFGCALLSALVATASAGGRSGLYASAVSAGLPTGFQLLGLGHLMTIFGSFAATAALGFVAIQESRLSHRREWLLALALVTFAFLSYTGTLLFASMTLVAASALIHRADRRLGGRLAALLLAGWGLALLLYYIHWVPAFFSETLPSMLESSGDGGSLDLAARIRLAPEKLDYTFGSWLFPLVGVAGLCLAKPKLRRLLLYCWALPLVLFSVFDLAFNFLLKHHYFSFPVIAIGLGIALHRFEEKGRWGRVILALFLVFLYVMGLREVLLVARGGA